MIGIRLQWAVPLTTGKTEVLFELGNNVYNVQWQEIIEHAPGSYAERSSTLRRPSSPLLSCST